MRIVHVIYSFGIGGLEKGITTLINYGSEDIEHVVISLCGNRESENLLTRKADIISLNKPAGNSPLFIWDLSRLLRKIRPDIVHTRNWSGMDGILAAKLAGVKTIIHGEHGWDMLDPYGTDRKRKLVRKALSLMVDRYVCVSKQIESWLRNDLKIKKEVVQIYNGIDVDRFHSVGPDEKWQIKRKLGFTDENFLIGIVGRLDVIKNHLNLFKAFRKVALQHPQVRLVVVGDGAERNRLEKDGDKDIIFLGYRSDTDILMKAFDLFILPSFNEGISNTILEAMATGLPVIASNVGGNPELVDDGVTGTLVDPYRPDQMADSIMAYMDFRALKEQHGRNGRKKACEKFSIKAMVQGYESVYKDVCRK